MARNAKFRISGRLGGAGGRLSEGTFTVDRGTNVVRIRRLRSHHETLTTLDALAEIAIWKEALKVAKDRKASKRGRR
jgi:hypothetical protein